MSNARTTSLHRKLPVELRERIERDLIEQPPGRSTYEEVWKFYALDTLDISIKAVERYGGYLRALHRNQWIREFGDVLVGEDLSPKIEGLIRTRLYEQLVSDEQASPGSLLKLAVAEKSLREARIKDEQWEARKREMAAELEKMSAMNGGRSELTPEVLAEIKSKVLGI